MKRLVHVLSPLFALLVFSAASWALYRELRNYHWSEFRQNLQDIPASRIAWALMLAILDYTILVGNDWIASRLIGRRIPLAKLAAGSVAGYAASHNLGAALGGTPVRIRFYSSWGVTPPEIAGWIAMLTVSFILGASATAGTIYLSHPTAPPGMLRWPLTNMRLAGAALLVFPVDYLLLCAVGRPLHWRNWSIRFPTPKLAMLQIAVASADLCCAAGILYVLLPPTASVNYSVFLSLYLLAAVASVCSHVPGGVGVFDLVMIKAINHGDPHGMLAALLVYRAVYYLFPLAVGFCLFVVHEVRIRNLPQAKTLATD